MSQKKYKEKIITMKSVLGKSRIPVGLIEKCNSVPELLAYRAEKTPDESAYVYRERPEDETVCTKTYSDLESDYLALGTRIMDEEWRKLPAPIVEGDIGPCAEELSRPRLAILGENRYEWVIAHHVGLTGPWISVPLDKQLSADEVLRLLNRAACSLLFLDASKLELLDAILASENHLRHIVLFGADSTSLCAEKKDPRLVSMTQVLNEGREKYKGGDRSFVDYPVNCKQVGAIYFTSGTTAQSKGVMLSQANIIEDAKASAHSVDIRSCKNGLSVLPMHHTFENTVGIYCYFLTGITCYLWDGLRYFSKNLKEWPIDIMITVPLMLEKIEKMVQKSIRKKRLEEKFARGLKLSGFARTLGIDLRRKFFASLLAQVAPELRIVIAGGAALKPETHRFFNSIGINTFQGYGLTETSPVLSCGNSVYNRPGSVGRPICGIELSIDSEATNSLDPNEGELLVRSKTVMKGYYQDEVATRAAIDADGYFHTGDVARLDSAGGISITGRVKTLIVLQNGKKIFPEEIEAELLKIDIVEQAMVFHLLDEKGVDRICARLQLNLSEESEMDDASAGELLRRSVEEINSRIASYKSINFVFWNEEAPIMTATLKIKRKPEEKAVLARIKTAGHSIQEANYQRF